MKHILIYIISAMLIFTVVERFSASEAMAKAPVGVVAMAKAVAQEPEQEATQVGLLLAEVNSVDEVYFKNALTDGLGVEAALHTVSTPATQEGQMAMFQKMVDSKYGLIVIQLFDRQMADDYIQLATQQHIPLIFTGVQPSEEQMAQGQDVYYVGYSPANALRSLADAVIKAWHNNRDIIDLDDSGDLAYGVLTGTDFAESGSQELFEGYLQKAGIKAAMGKNSVTQAFSFDLKKEIDRIWVEKPKPEFIICDSSSYARQASNYLNDPNEFKNNKIKFLLTTADESAQKMTQEGVALFATGTDGHDLGKTTAQLALLLLKGEKPSEQNMEDAPDRNKCILVANRSAESKELSIVVPRPASSEPQTAES